MLTSIIYSVYFTDNKDELMFTARERKNETHPRRVLK